MCAMYMPGATAVGITFDQGVVFASERRIAYGNFLVSKTTKKTFPITDFVGATCAGLVADMQLLSLQIAALAKIRKLELKRDVPPNSVAKMSSDKANSTKTGMVVENLHYISDKFWEIKKEIKD